MIFIVWAPEPTAAPGTPPQFVEYLGPYAMFGEAGLTSEGCFCETEEVEGGTYSHAHYVLVEEG